MSSSREFQLGVHSCNGAHNNAGRSCVQAVQAVKAGRGEANFKLRDPVRRLANAIDIFSSVC